MAEGHTFVCSHCARSISAWDDGDPYYDDADGTRHYAHHPDPARDLCVEVESPVLCLGCGGEAVSDSAAPLTACPTCASEEIVDMWDIEGRRCPYCRRGTFSVDSSSPMIS